MGTGVSKSKKNIVATEKHINGAGQIEGLPGIGPHHNKDKIKESQQLAYHALFSDAVAQNDFLMKKFDFVSQLSKKGRVTNQSYQDSIQDAFQELKKYQEFNFFDRQELIKKIIQELITLNSNIINLNYGRKFIISIYLFDFNVAKNSGKSTVFRIICGYNRVSALKFHHQGTIILPIFINMRQIRHAKIYFSQLMINNNQEFIEFVLRVYLQNLKRLAAYKQCSLFILEQMAKLKGYLNQNNSAYQKAMKSLKKKKLKIFDHFKSLQKIQAQKKKKNLFDTELFFSSYGTVPRIYFILDEALQLIQPKDHLDQNMNKIHKRIELNNQFFLAIQLLKGYFTDRNSIIGVYLIASDCSRLQYIRSAFEKLACYEKIPRRIDFCQFKKGPRNKKWMKNVLIYGILKYFQ